MSVLFFDTSAVLPLLIEESQTQLLQEIWRDCSEAWAWQWLRMEAEAALSRRHSTPQGWTAWRYLAKQFHFAKIDPQHDTNLCAFNRALKLRAADAGHLYVCDKLFSAVPDLLLLTMDKEMADAARRIGIPTHDACPTGMGG